MRVSTLVAIALSTGGCFSQTSKAAKAGISTAAAIGAAAVYRATTGGCWATCASDQACDQKSGYCVDLPCHGACRADDSCARIDGVDRCVRAARDTSAASIGGTASEFDAGLPAPARESPDRCNGECLPSQRCVTDAGEPRCELDDDGDN